MTLTDEEREAMDPVDYILSQPNAEERRAMNVWTLFKIGKPGRQRWATLTREVRSLTLRWGSRGS